MVNSKYGGESYLSGPTSNFLLTSKINPARQGLALFVPELPMALVLVKASSLIDIKTITVRTRRFSFVYGVPG